MLEKVYFSLGSNEGEREKNIRTALSMMDAAFGKPYSKLSTIIETHSWGYEGKDYLNCVVEYILDIEPVELLDKCEAIERALGRTDKNQRNGKGERIYRDRTIDIDILMYGNRKLRTERLTLPHPLMTQRAFVMEPLNEIIHTK